MKLKLFYEDMKGYADAEENVKKVTIRKVDNINTLIVMYTNGTLAEMELREVRLAYLIDIETMQELFRYEK